MIYSHKSIYIDTSVAKQQSTLTFTNLISSEKQFIYIGNKKKSWLTEIEPTCAEWHTLGDTKFNHLAIWTLYNKASVF